MNLLRLLVQISSSVTRWLPVVVGCAVLETAQPMNAAESPPAERSGDTLLIPGGGSSAAPTASTVSGGSGASWIFAGLVGLGAGGFWLWKRRALSPAARAGAGLRIEQTRPLGNRQFLVVAECDGRRFLLGVAPGGINMLSALESKEDDADAP